ncbi:MULTISPECIES: heme lyase CcmF/NrfE family subunit [unclassified Arsukibacterium]|uniref:heme lyase CcmF/NrfE family subunit n=1 Tax=unclassified Arsukibacterium TaxID=2635278 RepID=UPI0025C47A2D|nr:MULTISPECIES: heme lyase CcmF/NrfE family subunit [unclassified Arsukibacterium]|tara:strand:+ start:9631 stop:11610 length:1980 start_codon:yes stop_codon:yes gene_type:complete
MIAEYGQLALTFALALSVLLATVPLYGSFSANQRALLQAKPLAIGLFIFCLLAKLALVHAFLTSDFTVINVATNSSSILPWYYKITASFGSHEGSMLLWILMLSGWTALVAVFSKGLPLLMQGRILGVLGLINIGFIAFSLFMSNPFARSLPFYPVEGMDLNPLLQDFGMIIHPPLLYMGYVGFAVSFAFAIAALMGGKFDSTWARWARPWTLAAWLFLTLGIMFGSWWAYHELGWGGWWFWDPVENASFLPWLVGTALLHSLAVTEKRGTFKSWTVLLALGAFSLSLVGAFLVRSGVLVSVHSFAADPDRGIFLLIFLLLVIGGSLALYASRMNSVRSQARYQLFSREVMLWGNNVFLLTATLVVFLGTLFPLFHKELGLGTISIGEPFFNQMFYYLTIPFALLLGLGPWVRWKQQPVKPLLRPFSLIAVASLTLALGTLAAMQSIQANLALLGLLLGAWVGVSALYELYQRLSQFGSVTKGAFKLHASHYGMTIAHIGFAVLVVGVAMTKTYSVERDVRMQINDSISLAGYQFTLLEVYPLDGANYGGEAAEIAVHNSKGEFISQLHAEKRFYTIQRTVMTESAVHARLSRDLYVSLGEALPGNAWALRLYVKPFVRWIWLGGLLMALGALVALLDKRYRRGSSRLTAASNSEATNA